MCGIVAYLGDKPVNEIILEGLERLEYRGYDSAGVAIFDEDRIHIVKRQGKVEALRMALNDSHEGSTIGMGHTRWATHGLPNDINAHPHLSNNGQYAIVHNGIIENYHSLRKELLNLGYKFKSETDTEVLVNFIEEVCKNYDGSFEDAIRIVLKRVVGAYGLIIMNRALPDQLMAVRHGSPLVIGIGEGESFIASDATPFLKHTQNVIFLNDDEIAIVKNDDVVILDETQDHKNPYIEKLDLELEAIEKGGYPHFMLKEIFEQPKSIGDCFRGRLDIKGGKISLGGINVFSDAFYNATKIIMTACGTSFYSAKVAEYMFEELARIPVEVEYASEFRYRNPVIGENDIVIGISQSGETADTKVALEMSKELGCTIFGVCNVVGSSISRITDEGVYTHAGPEIGVASTKAFTAQLTVLALMAMSMGVERKTITDKRISELIKALSEVPKKIEQILEQDEAIKQLSERFQYASNFLYLGRGYNYPVALEGALKLKEISYIHAEGYPAAEMKHGPIALIDQDMPVVCIAIQDSAYEKVVSNIQEVKSRKGKVIGIITEGDEVLKEMLDYYIEVPKIEEVFSPLLTVIPLQLLAYHISVFKGRDVDQPRNLAKSVTVE